MGNRFFDFLKYLSAIGVFLGANNLYADNFIGFAQPGKPNSWALEIWPIVTNDVDSNKTYSAFTNVAYFSETGFTGTHRDQFEIWAGASPGYSKAAPGTGDKSFGVSSPQLGFEYYFNVMVPTKPYGDPDYRTYWISPTISLTFPNGNSKNSGYGAGGNQYTLGFNINNYFQYGKFCATFAPFEFYYAMQNRNATYLGNGQSKRFKAGLTVVVADIAAGYQLSNSVTAGIHHSYNFYCQSSSDFQESKEGKIGPSITYLGLIKHGIYLCGNVNFDYYKSNNFKKQTTLNMVLVKSF